MKVALSAPGTFHTFDLARELYARDALAGVLTTFPRFKLRGEGLPQELIHCFPLIHGAYRAFPWKHRLGPELERRWLRLDASTFAAYVGRKLPQCDVYVGLSGSSLAGGRRAHGMGASYICDRGSSHIRVQDRIEREEAQIWGMPAGGIDPYVIETEEAEYAAADRITVPSGFAYRTFLDQGVAPEKLRKLPYGVNLARFEPDGAPAEGRFDILFAGYFGLRKGVQYLVQAFERLQHPAKSLTFAGLISNETLDMLRQRGLWPEGARAIGPVPQTQLKTLMSRSHVLALPSVEDGFGLVLNQAMACGCPVIGTENTGAPDLVEDGADGFIVPIRDVDALAERLQFMADHPIERAAMGARALAKAQGFGGWSAYGANAMAIYEEAAAAK